MTLLDGLDDVPWANLRHAYAEPTSPGRGRATARLPRRLRIPVRVTGAIAVGTGVVSLIGTAVFAYEAARKNSDANDVR